MPCRGSSADYLDPLASTDQDFLEQIQAVGHDPVHAKIQEPLHLGGFVDGPHMHVTAQAVRAAQEPGRHHLHRPVADRNLENVDAGKQPACQRCRQHGAQEDKQSGERTAGRGSHWLP